MTDLEKEMMEALGLEKKDFEPSKQSDAARIAELEARNEMLTECIMELADIIYA